MTGPCVGFCIPHLIPVNANVHIHADPVTLASLRGSYVKRLPDLIMSVMSILGRTLTYWLWGEKCPCCFREFSKQITIWESRGQLTLSFGLFETCQKRTGIILPPGNSNAHILQAVHCSADVFGCLMFCSRNKISLLSLTRWPVRPAGLRDIFCCSPFLNDFLILSGIFVQVTSWESQADVLRKN